MPVAGPVAAMEPGRVLCRACKGNRARHFMQMPPLCTAAYFTKALQGRLRLCGAFLPYFGRRSMTYLLQNLDTAVLSNFTGRGLY